MQICQYTFSSYYHQDMFNALETRRAMIRQRPSHSIGDNTRDRLNPKPFFTSTWCNKLIAGNFMLSVSANLKAIWSKITLKLDFSKGKA